MSGRTTSSFRRALHRLAHFFGVNGVRLESSIERGALVRHRITGEIVHGPDVEMYVAYLVCTGCGKRTHFVTKPLWRAF